MEHQCRWRKRTSTHNSLSSFRQRQVHHRSFGRSEGNAIDKIVLSKFKNPILNFNDKKFEVLTKMEESAQNKILRQIFGTKKQISIYCIA